MSKTNNLKDYLTDLYEGISSRKPDASRNPQDFRREIESIGSSSEADSPLPPEISSDLELLSFISTAPVGSVFKYTGTTGAYENGALYIVEENS